MAGYRQPLDEYPTNTCRCGHPKGQHWEASDVQEPCAECDCEDFEQTYSEVI